MKTLVPAYYDYKTAKAAREAWLSGKDFRISDFFDPNDGRCINIQDAAPGKYGIRYKGLTQVCVVTK